MKKICVVSGTRADYGLLKPLLNRIRDADALQLQLCTTGMHLSPEYGFTQDEIIMDGFAVDETVEMLVSSDSSVGISKAIGLGVIGFSDAYRRLEPDCVLVLGDRYEILAASIAAMVAAFPIAHLHGGELTETMMDDAIRHSITKMSFFHFVATDEYRNRVLQLGEDPRHVYNVGGMGVDAIRDLDFMDREELEHSLGFPFLDKNLLITFHPVVSASLKPVEQLRALLNALSTYPNTRLIFTLPNADQDGRSLMQEIRQFCEIHSNAFCFQSLGYRRYLSCLQFVDGVVGNSSSGLLEVPSFKIGTVNIGDRQKGRLRASSVIDVDIDQTAIQNAIDKLYSPAFSDVLSDVVNPYGSGGASDQIVKILSKELNLATFSSIKPFYDMYIPSDD